MYIVNFSHPLTPENLAEVRRCLPALPADETITVVDIPTDIDRSLPIREEARRLVAAVPWREMGDEETYLINPPGLAILALAIQVVINAEYTDFAGWLTIRPVANALARTYEVAEVVDVTDIV